MECCGCVGGFGLFGGFIFVLSSVFLYLEESIINYRFGLMVIVRVVFFLERFWFLFLEVIEVNSEVIFFFGWEIVIFFGEVFN